MARSSYIYVVQDSFKGIMAAFTVKHEMESYLRKEGSDITVTRLRDGKPDARIDLIIDQGERYDE
jgi:hypothetical protein